MKHEEIYHTCDRCGKRIRPLPYFNLPYRRSPIYIMAITEEHHTGIKDKINQADKEDTVETLQLEIETWYHEKKDKYELCGDCRKAFKKFMDNKEE